MTNYPGDWTLQNDILMKGTVDLSKETTYLDTLGRKANAQITLFAGNKRITTTIKKDGVYQTGTTTNTLKC